MFRVGSMRQSFTYCRVGYVFVDPFDFDTSHKKFCSPIVAHRSPTLTTRLKKKIAQYNTREHARLIGIF